MVYTHGLGPVINYSTGQRFSMETLQGGGREQDLERGGRFLWSGQPACLCSANILGPVWLEGHFTQIVLKVRFSCLLLSVLFAQVLDTIQFIYSLSIVFSPFEMPALLCIAVLVTANTAVRL